MGLNLGPKPGPDLTPGRLAPTSVPAATTTPAAVSPKPVNPAYPSTTATDDERQPAGTR
jgi:hypothetical protein